MKKNLLGLFRFSGGVIALANDAGTAGLKEQLTGWLASKGITLANDAADQFVVTKVQEAFSQATAPVLANDNSAARLTVLENEKVSLNRKLQETTTALANEQTARQADRKVAAGAVVDEAIRRGIKTVADRDAAITTLANSADFAKDAEALLKTAPVKSTTTNGRDVSGKQQAALSNEQVALQNEYQAAFAAELVATGQNPTKAHQNIMSLPKYSGLAAKLAPKS